jgi:hypothetical protein
MGNLRDKAGELVTQEILLKNFKVSIFWIIWYKPSQNEADLIEYLTTYRMFQEQALNEKKKDINSTNYTTNIKT